MVKMGLAAWQRPSACSCPPHVQHRSCEAHLGNRPQQRRRAWRSTQRVHSRLLALAAATAEALSVAQPIEVAHLEGKLKIIGAH